MSTSIKIKRIVFLYFIKLMGTKLMRRKEIAVAFQSELLVKFVLTQQTEYLACEYLDSRHIKTCIPDGSG